MAIGTNRELQHINGWALPSVEDPAKWAWSINVKGPRAITAGMGFCADYRTAIDVGAHVGLCTIELLHQFNRVIAFEPAADSFAALVENVDTIGPHRAGTYRPAELINQAVGAGPGRVRMALAPSCKARGDTGARYALDGGGGTIHRVTIDSLGVHDLDYLIIDIEGGETSAIWGAIETLTRCSPVVVFADNMNGIRYNTLPDDPRRMLSGFGYREFEKSNGFATWVKNNED